MEMNVLHVHHGANVDAAIVPLQAVSKAEK
jgi:hypothetical protein